MGRESHKAGLSLFLPGSRVTLPFLLVVIVVGVSLALFAVMSGPSIAGGRLISPAEEARGRTQAGEAAGSALARTEKASSERYGDLLTPGLLEKARKEALARAEALSSEGDEAGAARTRAAQMETLDHSFSIAGNTEQGDQTFIIVEDGVTYIVHEYTAVGSSSFTPPSGVTEVEYLVVAGGGGGGPGGQTSPAAGGGGGAGGLFTDSKQVSDQPYAVTVGAGGAGGLPGSAGSSGSPSSFGSIETVGGGGGGIGGNAATSGGSGGGAGGRAMAGGETGGEGTPGQGNDGGDRTINNNAAAGGGGYGSKGEDSGDDSGDGGDGQAFPGFGVYDPIAGGGGGGGNDLRIGGLGKAGGGDGSTENGGQGQDGQDNTGGGGGGSAGPGGTEGGDGGSGIVIIRYEYEPPPEEIPHGGYSAVTDTCLQCHDMHEAEGDYVLMRENTVTKVCATCHTLYQKEPTGAYEPGFSGASAGEAPDLEVYKVDIGQAGSHDGHRLGLGNNDIPGGSQGLAAIQYLLYPDTVSATYYSATDGLYCASCHTPHGSFGEPMEIGVTLLKSRPNHVEDGVDIDSWPRDGGPWCGACHDQYLDTEQHKGGPAKGCMRGYGCHDNRVDDFPHTNTCNP